MCSPSFLHSTWIQISIYHFQHLLDQTQDIKNTLLGTDGGPSKISDFKDWDQNEYLHLKSLPH
jgi:hypothetical protein